jgi:hypothetical protein
METDIFVGHRGDDVAFSVKPFIYGLNGNDFLVGQGDGVTQIYGGQGNDGLAYNTGAASAKLYGDDGNDSRAARTTMFSRAAMVPIHSLSKRRSAPAMSIRSSTSSPAWIISGSRRR